MMMREWEAVSTGGVAPLVGAAVAAEETIGAQQPGMTMRMRNSRATRAKGERHSRTPCQAARAPAQGGQAVAACPCPLIVWRRGRTACSTTLMQRRSMSCPAGLGITLRSLGRSRVAGRSGRRGRQRALKARTQRVGAALRQGGRGSCQRDTLSGWVPVAAAAIRGHDTSHALKVTIGRRLRSILMR